MDEGREEGRGRERERRAEGGRERGGEREMRTFTPLLGACLARSWCGRSTRSLIAAGTGYEFVGHGVCVGADGTPTLNGDVAIHDEVRARYRTECGVAAWGVWYTRACNGRRTRLQLAVGLG